MAKLLNSPQPVKTAGILCKGIKKVWVGMKEAANIKRKQKAKKLGNQIVLQLDYPT